MQNLDVLFPYSNDEWQVFISFLDAAFNRNADSSEAYRYCKEFLQSLLANTHKRSVILALLELENRNDCENKEQCKQELP